MKLNGNNIRSHLNNFMDKVDKLAEMNVNINEDLLSIMMLYSLSTKFENFRVAIESRDTLPTPDEYSHTGHFATQYLLTRNEKLENTTGILDSGCTSQMTYQKDLFTAIS